jgi:hypothetical protein
MHAETVVALVSTGLAAIIAVTVPWVAFRLALRQDQARWLREQRAQLYVDLLTEAYAEKEWLEYAMADDETRETMRTYFHDLRLPPLERARLGARGTIFASKTVNLLFNRLGGEAGRAMLNPRRDEGVRLVTRMAMAGALDKLEGAVRRELGTDRILLDAGTAADGRPTQTRSDSGQSGPSGRIGGSRGAAGWPPAPHGGWCTWWR